MGKKQTYFGGAIAIGILVTLGTRAIAIPPQKALQLAQVTSVSELSDVQPTDWAYQALQSLVERWGCIAGYPDRQYRGNQPLSRYEFAAGLNACLDRLANSLDDSGTDVTDEDLAIVRRLQTEFAAELETLRGRVDALEARTAQLEAGQFSTTTQLSGEVSFAVSSAFGDRKADGDDLDSIPVFNNRVRLSFDTSFTGQDRLSTQLEALSVIPFGPGEDDEPNVTGTNMTRTAFDEGTENDVVLSKLYYAFPVSDRLHLSVDAIGGEFSETVSETYNEYFEEEFNGAISRFGRLNPIYYQGEEGTGLTLNYELSEAIDISAGYLALNASEPTQKNGLFNGSHAALVQLGIEPAEGIEMGLTYVRAYYPGEEVAVSGETGSELANAPFGEDVATTADHFGLQTSVEIHRAIVLSGWTGLTRAHAQLDGEDTVAGDDATLFNWAVTLAFPDLGSQGSLGGLIFGQPPRVTSHDGGDREDSAWHLEAQYRYQMSDHLAINPGVFVVINPENNDDNDSIWVGTLRAIFEF